MKPLTFHVPKSEAVIQREILDWLTKQGIWNKRIPAQGIRGTNGRKIKSPLAGMPDILFIHPNSDAKVGFIEVKSEIGKLSPIQKETIEQLENEGCLVIVAQSLDDIIPHLTIKSFTI